MYLDKVEDCDSLIIDLYFSFIRKRDCFLITQMNVLSYISCCYDNAFKKMKTKKIRYKIAELLDNPLDAYYLPLTMEMITKDSPNKTKNVWIHYIRDVITPVEMGFRTDIEDRDSSKFELMVEQLKYNSIVALKYCDGEDVMEVLDGLAKGDHKGFSDTAQKSYNYILKNRYKR